MNLEGWTASKNGTLDVYAKGKLRAVRLETTWSTEGAALASAVIDAAGRAFGDRFYETWNGQADVRLYQDAGRGILAVMSMARDGDEYGPEDTPTFAWTSDDDGVWLVGSKKWRETATADALGVPWPEKAQFDAFTGVQGWGE